MDATQPQTQMMVEYARNILDNYTRCQTKQAEVEKGLVELVELKTEIWDINDDTGLETFIAQIDSESDIYYTKVEKVRSDNLIVFEKCKSLLAPAKAQTPRQAQATNPNITTGFKPNQDLKPLYLIKDCTLTELNKFIDTFTNYIMSSTTQIPAEALWGQASVNMDAYWFTELREKCFLRESNLTSFLKQMEEFSLIKSVRLQPKPSQGQVKPKTGCKSTTAYPMVLLLLLLHQL